MGSSDGVAPNRWRRVGLAALVLFALVSWQKGVAQANTDANSDQDLSEPAEPPYEGPRYTVSGTVVSSLHGEPIRHVLVSVAEDGSAALTDLQGHFEVTGIRAGSVTFEFRKPGFSSIYGESSGSAGVEVGPDLAPLLFKLASAGAITGHVTDSDGRPVGDAWVTIEPLTLGGVRRDQVAPEEKAADEHGRFRFESLAAGNYFISVAYGIMNSKNRERAGIATTLYPGVSEHAQAGIVHLHPGEQFTAAITAPGFATAYHIAGTVSGLGSGNSLTFIRLAGEDSDFQQYITIHGNRFECLLPAGTYTTVPITSSYQEPELSSGTIEVNRDLSDVHVFFSPAPSIPVKIFYDSDQLAPPSAEQKTWMQIGLIGHRYDGGNPVVWRPDRSELINAVPGNYDLDVTTPAPWRVKSARYEGADLLAESLVVRPGTQPAPLELTLSDDAATLRVTIPGLRDVGGIWRANELEEGEAQLVLVSTDNQRHPIQFLPVNSPDEEIGGLAPGDYAVGAFMTGGGFMPGRAPADRAALRDFLATAKRIHLSPKSTTAVTVPLTEGGQ